VSYSFPSVKYATLQNTSDVSISFIIRVPADKGSAKKMFTITPAKGTL